ncbi:MAG TPA: sulfotransferase [Methylocella sp.]|nr:sulfotransferase [Methylocella sp.]
MTTTPDTSPSRTVARLRLVGAVERTFRNLRYQLIFISFIRPAAVLTFRSHLGEIDLRYLPRLLLLCLSGLAAQPLRFLETALYGKRIAITRIEEPPIFIIGHWRSGTTHLHNLMSCDPRLGFVSMYQAIAPDFSLIGRRWLKPLLARILPAKRPMDEMVWPIDSPQEEEVALGKVTPYSFYVQFLFPRRARFFFERHVLGRHSTDAIMEQVKKEYLHMLRVATIHAGGRRLILKNPVNTGRVALLLDLFPGAKFIHIHRSPLEVYASTRNLQKKILGFTTLQKLDESGSVETTLALYDGMMRRFIDDRALIPQQDLAEIRFEDLERDPVGEIERVYADLHLSGFAEARPNLEHYVDSLRSYRKNRFVLPEAERELVRQRWGFAFRAFGYSADPADV